MRGDASRFRFRMRRRKLRHIAKSLLCRWSSSETDSFTRRDEKRASRSKPVNATAGSYHRLGGAENENAGPVVCCAVRPGHVLLPVALSNYWLSAHCRICRSRRLLDARSSQCDAPRRNACAPGWLNALTIISTVYTAAPRKLRLCGHAPREMICRYYFGDNQRFEHSTLEALH